MSGAPETVTRRGLLFVCWGNSCRNIMAEALARHRYPAMRPSAGLRPLGYVAEKTLGVLAEAGVSTEGLWSKSVISAWRFAWRST